MLPERNIIPGCYSNCWRIIELNTIGYDCKPNNIFSLGQTHAESLFKNADEPELVMQKTMSKKYINYFYYPKQNLNL